VRAMQRKILNMKTFKKSIVLILYPLILVAFGIEKNLVEKRTVQMKLSLQDGVLTAKSTCVIGSNFGVLTRAKLEVIYDFESLTEGNKNREKILMAKKLVGNSDMVTFIRLEIDNPKLTEKLIREAPSIIDLTGYESIEVVGNPTLDKDSPTNSRLPSNENWRLDQVFQVVAAD
jgi:hypothetical protein